MANLQYNHYKSSKNHYKCNLLFTLTTYIYSSMLLYSVKTTPNKYLVCVTLDAIRYYLMLIYILFAYCKAMICRNKALCGYKSFRFESFTSC